MILRRKLALSTLALSTTSHSSWLQRLLFPTVNLSPADLHQQLAGKTIVLTGASYGIGEALCYLLAGCQAHLILVARTADKLAELKDYLEFKGSKVTTFACDLTDQQQTADLINAILAITDLIDIFINNAGKSICRSLQDSLQRFHDVQRTMALNYFAPVQLTLALIPYLRQRRGQIISVSAANVLLAPTPYWAAYQASKSAFDQWLRCVAPELANDGVAVSSVYLPLVRTRMIAPTKAYQDMPAMTPEQAAMILAKIMLNRSSRYAPWWLIFGQLASVIFNPLWLKLSSYYLRKKQ